MSAPAAPALDEGPRAGKRARREERGDSPQRAGSPERAGSRERRAGSGGSPGERERGGSPERRVEGASAAPHRAAAAPPADSEPWTVALGAVRVSAVGLGTLALGVAYPTPALRPTGAALHALVSAAARAAAPAALLVDTADTYCEPCTAVHALERELAACAAALGAGAGALALSTKSGMLRVNGESTGWRPAPAAVHSAQGVRAAIVAARHALSPGQPLLLWSLHHADGLAAPGKLEEALGAAKACVAEGLVQHVGLCNASVPLLRRALRVLPIAAVQNEWSPYQREAEKELPAGAAASSKKGVLRECAKHGVLFVAYAPLGGLKARRGERSLARDFPRAAEVARSLGCSVHAACLAAMLGRARALNARVLLIPGARTAEHAVDSCAAARLRLTAAQVDDILPPVF